MSGKRHEPSVGETHSLEAKMSFLTMRAQVEDSGPGICAEAVFLR